MSASVLLFALAAAAPLPDDVIVPTTTESIGIGEIYAVRDGKLWVKRASAEKSASWSLFDGTGAVPNVASPIVAVFSDELDHFMVVTADGAMHHHENGAWDSLWGLPHLPNALRAPLSFPSSLSKLRAGNVAYSMRRDHVLYYEDANGAQFHWGDAGTTSVFILDDDGRRIHFADPWLPPDISREICAPERGSVKLASLAASASMMFVIAVDGEMFTRFEDYDHDGGTPLFQYEYRKENATKPPPAGKAGTDPSSSSQTRFLPGDDWHAQSRIALTGKAKLTRKIAIVQNGQGNNARELRVIGTNENGDAGVYTKSLTATSWSFTPKAATIDDAAWLDAADTKAARGAPPSLSYAGFLRADFAGAPLAYASTSDFWFHCSPFHLTLTVDGVDVKLLVHAVDAWTFFTENNPVDDDTATKRLKLTFALEPSQKLDDKTRASLESIFDGKLDKAFAFVGLANQHELVVAPSSYPWNFARARWTLVMRSNPAERALAHVTLRPATKLARAAGLDLDDDALHRSRCALDAKLRARAASTLAQVRDARAQAETRLLSSMALEAAMPAGTGAIDVATGATATRFLIPVFRWMNFLELHVPTVVSAPVLGYRRYLDASRADFDDVERKLARCAGAS